MQQREPTILPPYDIESLRADVPLYDRLIPLNHCSQAPPTAATLAASDRFVEIWTEKGMDWDAWIGQVEAARAEFAGLIGATPHDVAVFSSVSHATAAVASTLDFSGDRNGLVLTEAEFPTVAHVWLWQRRRGARVTFHDPGPGRPYFEGLGASLDPHVRIVSLSHGFYGDGTLADLSPVLSEARAGGALTFVDAYQTLGTVPIDVTELDVDFLVGGALKYLMGVAGIAFLYVNPKIADGLEPAVTGWFGRTEPFAFDAHTLDWAPGARRFDSGTPPLQPAYIATEGIRILRDIGVDRIRSWTTRLSRRLMEGGRERGLSFPGPTEPAGRTPMVAFNTPPGEAAAVEASMRERGFLVSARGDLIRLAPHYHNTIQDIDRALDALAEVVDLR